MVNLQRENEMLGIMSVTKLSIAVTAIPLSILYDFSFDLSKIQPYKKAQSQTISKNLIWTLFLEKIAPKKYKKNRDGAEFFTEAGGT